MNKETEKMYSQKELENIRSKISFLFDTSDNEGIEFILAKFVPEVDRLKKQMAEYAKNAISIWTSI